MGLIAFHLNPLPFTAGLAGAVVHGFHGPGRQVETAGERGVQVHAEGQGIVALGRLNENKVLIADEVLAKHDENYMPPEVAESLEKAKVSGSKSYANDAYGKNKYPMQDDQASDEQKVAP